MIKYQETVPLLTYPVLNGTFQSYRISKLVFWLLLFCCCWFFVSFTGEFSMIAIIFIEILITFFYIYFKLLIKRQTSGKSSDNEWQQMKSSDTMITTSVTTSNNEGKQVIQRVTPNDNEWYNEWKWVITICITGENK